MPSNLINNLFPPQVATFQPAFIYNTAPTVSFSISPYNSANQISYLHVSVVDQRNNENVLLGSLENFWNADNNKGYGLINGILVIAFPQGESDDYENNLIHYHRETNLYTVSIPPKLLRKKLTVKRTFISSDSTATTIDKEPITETGLVDSKYFNVGQYYKVQLRLDCCKEKIGNWVNPAIRGDIDTDLGKDGYRNFINYLVDYREFFSEWSEVSLIKPIFHVNFYFPQLENSSIEGGLFTLNRGLASISAKVTIQDELYYNDKQINNQLYNTIDGLIEEDEHLERYKITIHPASETGELNKSIIVAETDWIYSLPVEKGATTEYGVNTSIDLDNTTPGEQYGLLLEYYTNNNYHGETSRLFEISYEFEFFDPPRWHNRVEEQYLTSDENGHVEVNQEDGYVKIRFRWKNNPKVVDNVTYTLPPGFLYIRRASSLDHFKTWKLIGVTSYDEDSITKNNGISFDFDDYTVASLTTYRYSAQYRMLKAPSKTSTNSAVVLAAWTKTYYSDNVYMQFYDMLIQRKNRQIAIRYNGQISSWKPVVNRQKVDTLGGKYPKFVENAQMNYRQFAINGLISAEGDFNRTFLNEFDGDFVLDNNGDYYLLEDGTYTKDQPADIDSKVYKKYRWVYKYDDEMQMYDSIFDGKHLVRNDTDPDGEYGWNPKLKRNEYETDIGQYKYGGITPDSVDSLEDYDNGYDFSIFGDITPQDISWTKYYQHDMYPMDNWYWERVFREELINWLNDGEPKLYRSMPEGNLAVMITDVNLTPNQQLGRRLYNFSATLYEIGDGYDLDILEKMGIVIIPKLKTVYGESTTSAELVIDSSTEEEDQDDDGMFSSTIKEVGQLWLPRTYGFDLINGSNGKRKSGYNWDELTIFERLNAKYMGALSSYSIDPTLALPWVRFHFSSPPKYYISKQIDSTNIWKSVDMLPIERTTPILNGLSAEKDSVSYNLNYLDKPYIEGHKERIKNVLSYNQKEGSSPLENAEEATLSLGYLLSLNSNDIFVNDRGFYEVPEGTSVTSLQLRDREFIGDHLDDVVIDYFISYKREKTSGNIPIRTSRLEKIVGQIGDIFPYNTTVRDIIQKKYEFIKYATPYIDGGYNWMINIEIPEYIEVPKNDSQIPNESIIPRDVDQVVLGQTGDESQKTFEIKGYKYAVGDNFYYKSIDSDRARKYESFDELWADDINWENYSKLEIKYTQALSTWQGISVDVTPYTVMKVRYPDSDIDHTMVVGRTGVLSFFDDNPVTQLQFCGRRMVQAPWERQPYLDEWEYVLCDLIQVQQDLEIDDFHNIWNNLDLESQAEVLIYFGYSDKEELVRAWQSQYMQNGKIVFPEEIKRYFYPYWMKMSYSNLLEIDRLTYNTVYPIGINGETHYYIYYIDDNFYEVETKVTYSSTGLDEDKVIIADMSQGTIVAKVPIYGYVNYTGEILRSWMS